MSGSERLCVSASGYANELQEMLNSLVEIRWGFRKLQTTVDEKQHLKYATSALASLRAAGGASDGQRAQ